MNQTGLKERTAQEKQRKVENLVDLLLKAMFEDGSPEIKTLVGHRFPDDDTWLCLWMAKKFIPKAKDAEITFVNAGQYLLGKENDPAVLYFDTGGGQYDQHGKGFRKSSSANLIAEKLGFSADPGLKPLMEMAMAVDNVEKLPETSLHFVIEGYPRIFQTNGTIDWQTVQGRVFEFFDIIYGQETARNRSRENLSKHAEWTTLPNSIKVASLLWHPECRDAAFEAGAHVVIWTISRGKNHFYTGIQVNRNYPVYLDFTAAALRNRETQRRGINIQQRDLRYVGRGEAEPCWYLHDSKRLILNGSRTWNPTTEEYTSLVPREIVGLVLRTLSTIPREIVSRWNTK